MPGAICFGDVFGALLDAERTDADAMGVGGVETFDVGGEGAVEVGGDVAGGEPVGEGLIFGGELFELVRILNCSRGSNMALSWGSSTTRVPGDGSRSMGPWRSTVVAPTSSMRAQSSGARPWTNSAPSSTVPPPSTFCERILPPTRGLTSRTQTRIPRSARARAAVRPAMPAPRMRTSISFGKWVPPFLRV